MILACAGSGLAGELEEYVAREDPHFAWKIVETTEADGFQLAHLEMTSQQWREHLWTHHLRVVTPSRVRNPDIAMLFITGDGSGSRSIDMLRVYAERAGAMAGVLTRVPNQPLYEGRKEDALIAYTFDQYSKTGDATWPLLYPMVKSAVRAMDTLQAYARETAGRTVRRFLVTGASKRGWTTWLTGAVDPRVVAIAPIVIDMLNMKAQLEWTEKCYGRQSEQIHDYTEFNLHLRMDEPRIVALRQGVDPYEYRKRYTMPKLILLGTNDPYWTVDAIRNYWDDLPEPKLIYQTPNAGHDLAGGKDATQTLAAFFQMIADRQALPTFEWTFAEREDGAASVQMKVNQQAAGMRLWTSHSEDRDFRDAQWESRDVMTSTGSTRAEGAVTTPDTGYRALLGEVTLRATTGDLYQLSTAVRVTPQTFR